MPRPRDLPFQTKATRMNKPDYRFIGKPIRRAEDERLITGRGRFTDDFRIDGQSYAVMVRSPYPHARIVSIDKAPALAMPGVLGVFTGADCLADKLGAIPHDPIPKTKYDMKLHRPAAERRSSSGRTCCCRRQGAPCGRGRRHGRRRNAGAGAGRRRGARRRLRGAALRARPARSRRKGRARRVGRDARQRLRRHVVRRSRGDRRRVREGRSRRQARSPHPARHRARRWSRAPRSAITTRHRALGIVCRRRRRRAPEGRDRLGARARPEGRARARPTTSAAISARRTASMSNTASCSGPRRRSGGR